MVQKQKNRTSDKTTKKIKKLNQQIIKIIWISSIGSLVFVLLVFALFKVYGIYQHHFQKMEKLDREIIDLRSSMNIDSVRQYKLQKIISIIQGYNDDLTSVEVYDIASEIYEMSIKYSNLDIDLLCAVVTHESGLTWDPKAVSDAGALGLMQIMPVTGLFLAEYEGITWTTPQDVCFNPIYNIRMGSRFLSILIEQYGLEGGLAAYNGGEKQASLWLRNGKDDQFLWSETRTYIPAIQKLYDTYMAQSL
ncbi:lytic transglycosylase domain-containing protein [bacterium]|nr:lytic transglycosylase domain-containing protein [bacterium]